MMYTTSIGMPSFLFVIFASLIFFPTKSHAATEEVEHVLTLTSKNFDDVISQNDLVLVKFYAPWCGHCKKLAPEYEMAAKKLSEQGSPIKLAKVDSTEENELSDKYGVRGYPTLQLFRKKVPEEYQGGRTADTILEFLEKMSGPAVEYIMSNTRSLESSNVPISFVGRFKTKESDVSKLFERVADASRVHGKFVAYIDDSNEDTIHAFRMDEDEITLEGSLDEETLRKFIVEESFPMFGPINGENFKQYADRGLDLAWFCGTEGEYTKAKKIVQVAASPFRKDFSFVWLDTDNFKGHAENALGVVEFPSLVLQTKKGRFIIPQSAMLDDSPKIITFIQDVQAGKVERNLKSEPIPEQNDEPVKVIVGKTFESMVIQKDKDVLLEVYAPWCGHCKKLEPIYNELAEKIKDVPHILIAKMDGTANESPVEEFEWTGFPTLFFVKAGETVPQKFDGDRTVKGILEYLQNHSTKPIDVSIEETEAAPDRSEEL